MIIQCEKCRTKFNFDESLLKSDGSKVRCSVCHNIFVAYPPEAILDDGPREERLVSEVTPATSQNEMGEEVEGEREETEQEWEESMSSLLSEAETEETSAKPVQQRKKPLTLRVLLILVLIFILFAGAGTAIFFWAPHLIPDSLSTLFRPEKNGSTDSGVSALSFESVRGTFVDSEKAGRLFVIRGMVRNNYKSNRSLIRIKGSVFDENGQVVKEEEVYAGNSLKDDDLRHMTIEEIKSLANNRYGTQGRNFNIDPSAAIPFIIIFEELSDNLSEFTVEAVSSSPGT